MLRPHPAAPHGRGDFSRPSPRGPSALIPEPVLDPRSLLRGSTLGEQPEEITFISGSAESPPEDPPCCPLLSRAWNTYKAVLCYVVTCSHCPQKDPETYLPSSLEGLDSAPHNGNPAGSPRPARGERGKSRGLNSSSFSYPDVKFKGMPVYNRPDTCPRENMRDPPLPPPAPLSRSSAGEYYSLRESDPELSRLSGSMSSTEIDVLIWQKLTELFSLHQIDELARCTSETVFLEKTSQITDLISSLTQDYRLEQQDAECRLVRGIIRISTRKGRASTRGGAGQQQHSRGKGPDSGNETMHESALTSQDDLDVQISEETTSDLVARNMRRSSTQGSPFAKEDSLQDTETDSSGAPLLKVYC